MNTNADTYLGYNTTLPRSPHAKVAQRLRGLHIITPAAVVPPTSANCRGRDAGAPSLFVTTHSAAFPAFKTPLRDAPGDTSSPPHPQERRHQQLPSQFVPHLRSSA